MSSDLGDALEGAYQNGRRLLARGTPLIFIPEPLRDFRVYVVADGLWLGNLPFRSDHVDALKESGARTVLNLCEDCEYRTFRTLPSQREELEAAYAADGIKEIRLPMADKSAHLPTVFDQALSAYRAARSEGAVPFFVHCRGGKERSVTVVAALLVAEHGYTVAGALEHLADIYPSADPLRGQRRALAAWAADRQD
jgi:protein-tyrosine phosphatase